MALLEAVVPIFSLILLGWVARRFSFISDRSTSTLNIFAFFFALPALFFVSIYRMDFNLLLNANLMLAILVPIVLVSLLAFVMARAQGKDRKTTSAYFLGSFLGQNAYMGIPFVSLAYGVAYEPLAGLIASIYFSFGMAYTLFMMEYFSKKDFVKSLTNLLKTPALWGIIMGFAVSFLSTYYGVGVPDFIDNTMALVAAPASAVALFALGTFMYRRSRVDLGEVLSMCFIKNIALPVLAFIAVLLFGQGLGRTDAAIVVVQAAMPIAVSTFVLSEQYRTRRELISNSIIVSTAISVAILSLLTMLT